jgi:mono/diheme cytochrome c family protein
VAAGLDVFLREGCPACHRIAGVHASAEHGPALTAIARRRSREELRDRLLRPQAASPRTPMPPVIVPGEELVRLVRFLEAQTGAGERLPGRELAPTTPGRPRLADHFPAEHPRAPNATAGALFVRRLGCRGCHALGEREAGVPDLSYVGWYRTAKDVREALRDPARRFPGTFMPRPDMPEAVIESLVSYLAARRAPLPSTPAQVYAQACRRCHGRPGARDPKAVVLMGKPPILDPGLARVPRARFLEVVRDGRAGTAMPAWGRVLSPRFIEELAGSLAAAGGRP